MKLHKQDVSKLVKTRVASFFKRRHTADLITVRNYVARLLGVSQYDARRYDKYWINIVAVRNPDAYPYARKYIAMSAERKRVLDNIHRIMEQTRDPLKRWEALTK